MSNPFDEIQLEGYLASIVLTGIVGFIAVITLSKQSVQPIPPKIDK